MELGEGAVAVVALEEGVVASRVDGAGDTAAALDEALGGQTEIVTVLVEACVMWRESRVDGVRVARGRASVAAAASGARTPSTRLVSDAGTYK